MESCADRSALHGLEERLFKLVSKKATSTQWAEWLRAPLEHALAEGDRDLAVSLLKAGANGGAGWKGCDGRTLLDAAAEGGNDGALSDLLTVGGLTDVNAASGSKSMTALHRASRGGHTTVAKTLLLEGADVTVVDSDQRSALHHALEGGHEELARQVIVAGADLNAKERGGNTPLHFAAALSGEKLACTLLRRGVGVDVANGKGQCPLHVAVENVRMDVAEALLKAGADPNLRYDGARIKKRCSPLYVARNDTAMTRMLLKHGADVSSVDALGYTQLHNASGNGTPGVISALVEGGADLQARSVRVAFCDQKHVFKGFTPLHVATMRGRYDNMATLLLKGANIHAKDDDGQTPLHVVCKVSAEDPSFAHKSVDFLLRRGADETITDNDGHTPEDLIESSAASEGLRKLLANAPADRTWRRRGMLVMCRAHLAKVGGGSGDGKAGKVQCQGKGAGAGAAAAAGGGEGECVLTRLVGLEAKEVFRTIVMFL